MLYYTIYDSPIGPLLLTAGEDGLTGLRFGRVPPESALPRLDHPILLKTAQWLDAYFRGEASPPDFPLSPQGTAFQKSVWEILLTIPYGKTRTYGDIAKEMAAYWEKETMSAQAVGGAVGRNPISILIPCHRVVGGKGQLTGYAGGMDKKIWLLRHEGRNIIENTVLQAKE